MQGLPQCKEDNTGSDFGPYVDIVAPGTDIASTFPNNQYGSANGTSASVAFVSGTAALVWSVNPEFTAKDVHEIIVSSATATGNFHPDNREVRRLNAFDAVKAARLMFGFSISGFSDDFGKPLNYPLPIDPLQVMARETAITIENQDAGFNVEEYEYINTTSAALGRFSEIVTPGGYLVSALASKTGISLTEAETVVENVRKTADIYSDDGIDVDLLFRGGIFIFTAELDNVNLPTINGPIEARVTRLDFGFLPTPEVPLIQPFLLSATEGNGMPGSKQFITDGTLKFLERKLFPL